MRTVEDITQASAWTAPSPQRLVAAALLGYAALVNPTSVSGVRR
jgi:hypothetical protein